MTEALARVNPDAIRKYLSEEDGVTQFETAIKELTEQNAERAADWEEMVKLVEKIHDLNAKENVYTKHAFEQLTNMFNELKTILTAAQEGMPTFTPLAAVFYAAYSKLKNIATEEVGDEKRSVRLQVCRRIVY